MVRIIAFLIGLVSALAATLATAAEPVALPPLPETDFPGQPVTREFSLVGFPDGTAALQETIAPHDAPPFPDRPPERLWLIRIDGAGHFGHWQRLPVPDFYGATIARGLPDHSILMLAGDRGYTGLAKVDVEGTLLWQESYESTF